MYYVGDIRCNINKNVLSARYYCNDILYGIVDTKDMLEEFYTEEEVYNMIKSGLVIEGVSRNEIISVKDKIKVKHTLAGLEYKEPIRLDTDYLLRFIDNTYSIVSKEGIIIDTDVSLDRIKYLINKDVRLANIVNCSRCYLSSGDYYIFEGKLHSIRDLISGLIAAMRNVLSKAIDLGILTYDNCMGLNELYLNALYYNYKYDTFILCCGSKTIIVKYGLNRRSTYFRLYDKTLGKDIRMRDVLHTELFRYGVKSIEFVDKTPMKYCFNVSCDCYSLRIL